MDYPTAEKLMGYRELADALDAAAEIVGSLPNVDEQKQLRRPMARWRWTYGLN